MSNLLDFEKVKPKSDLVRDNLVFSGRGVRPDVDQSISSIRPFIKAVASSAHPQISLGEAKSLVLIGLDSIKYEFAEGIFNPNNLVCLTSVFPSTSICAWPSAFTGKSPEEFRSIGPVFYAKEIDALYNALDDSYRTTAGGFLVDPTVTNKYPMGIDDNIFTDLNALNFQTVCINGFYAQKTSRWSQAFQRGAERVDISKSDWSKIVMHPDLIVKSIIEDVTDALNARDRNRNSFIWTLSDIDCYVHEHGYSDDLKTVLPKLDDFFRQLASEGHVVIAFADHGQVPQKISTFTEGWNAIHSDENCRMPSGGAGRVRWSYPKEGREDYLHQKIQELLGDSAAVIRRDELESLGVLPLGKNLKSQIGEIVVFGLTDDYPLAVHGDGFIYEHGSVTEAEMLVPLMVYKVAAKEVSKPNPSAAPEIATKGIPSLVQNASPRPGG